MSLGPESSMSSDVENLLERESKVAEGIVKANLENQIDKRTIQRPKYKD